MSNCLFTNLVTDNNFCVVNPVLSNFPSQGKFIPRTELHMYVCMYMVVYLSFCTGAAPPLAPLVLQYLAREKYSLQHQHLAQLLYNYVSVTHSLTLSQRNVQLSQLGQVYSQNRTTYICMYIRVGRFANFLGFSHKYYTLPRISGPTKSPVKLERGFAI